MANFLVENIVKINANESLRGKRTSIAVPPQAEQEFQRLMHQHPQVNHAAGARRKDERSKQQQGIRNNMIPSDVDGPQITQGSSDFSQSMDGKKEYKVQEREANIKQDYQVEDEIEDEVDTEFVDKFESILAEESHHHSSKPIKKKSQDEQDKLAAQQNSPLVAMGDDRHRLPGSGLHHHHHNQQLKQHSGNNSLNSAKYASSDMVGLDNLPALKMDDDQSAKSSAEGVEENILFKYLQEKLIESVWVAKGKNAAEVGLVIRLQGGIFEESFFHLNKVDNEYNLNFFIANGELMELIRARKSELSDALNDRFYDSNFNLSFQKIDGSHEHFAQYVDSFSGSSEGQDEGEQDGGEQNREGQKEHPQSDTDIWNNE